MGDAANGLTVCVLIDYQNIHLTARDVFSPPGTGARDTLGQQQIPQLRLTRLQPVRVYRGMPSNHREPQLYSAAQRQHAMWTRDHRVDVTTRTLRYPYNWGKPSCQERPREKGIDVLVVETAGWQGARRIKPHGRNVWHTALDASDYMKARDRRSYW
jgi:hypothetical protein